MAQKCSEEKWSTYIDLNSEMMTPFPPDVRIDVVGVQDGERHWKSSDGLKNEILDEPTSRSTTTSLVSSCPQGDDLLAFNLI